MTTKKIRMSIKRRRSTRRCSSSTTKTTATTRSAAGINNEDDRGRNSFRTCDSETTNKKQKLNSSASAKKNWTRPGVEAASRLASSDVHDHIDSWNTALSYYDSMLLAKGQIKLYNLDKQRQAVAQQQWRRRLLNEDAKQQKQLEQQQEENMMAMTKDQLLNVIIPWKFVKGKPRNALKPLLQSNSEKDVIKASEMAFHFADSTAATANTTTAANHVEEAIKSLCRLHGVGPATASAVLSAYRPDAFAFMDDEVIECLYDGKRGYTLKIYLMVNDRCVDLAEQLNEASRSSVNSSGRSRDEEFKWTPASVAKALWTVATMSAMNDQDGLCEVFRDY